MNLTETLNWRYATKRMNGNIVPEEKLNKILEAIRLAPTSMGLQPFKVFVIEDKVLKEHIYNEACQQSQIKESSHILVFAANKNVNIEQVNEYLSRISTVRNIPLESLEGFKGMFGGIIASDEEKNFNWTSRQAYIAFGIGIVAAAMENIDATPIEGFNPAALDKILGLSEQNLGSVNILALGYRDEENDKLATLAKVRKTKEALYEYK